MGQGSPRAAARCQWGRKWMGLASVTTMQARLAKDASIPAPASGEGSTQGW